MLKVNVRFDKQEEAKTIKIIGYAKTRPRIGKAFSFTTLCESSEVEVLMGVILNMQLFKNMALVQTNLITAEIWFSESEADFPEGDLITLTANGSVPGGRIIPLRRPRTAIKDDTC